MTFIETSGRLGRRFLPTALYAFGYRRYFKLKTLLSNMQCITVISATDIPAKNRKKVKFQLTEFTSCLQILGSITNDVCYQLSSFSLIPIKSDNENVNRFFLHGDSENFDRKIVALISQGFRVSIAGRDESSRKGEFYNLCIERRSPLCLYRSYYSSKGAAIFQEEVAVHIYILRERNSSTLVSVCDNDCFKSIERTTLNDERFQSAINDPSEYDFDVDVVITWVDGDDATWLEKKNHYAGKTGALPTSSKSSSRYQSRDELRYCIRALLMYAPWVRHIYLVTDQQVPAWFYENEKVQIVDHTDIFSNSDALPVFNSHAIESNLHRIEGLAENFLYFNDDVILRKPISKSNFFSPFGRQSKFFYSRAAFIPAAETKDLLPVDFAALNNARLIEEITGFRPRRKFQHTPIALKRSTLENLEAAAPEVFATTGRSRFRAFTDYSIASALAHHYGYYLGTAEPGSIGYTYINLGEKTARLRIERLFYNDKDYSCFCINDVDNTDDLETDYLTEVLESIYCQKSVAEG